MAVTGSITLTNTVPFPRQARSSGCPVDLCVAAIGGRWKPTIIYNLNEGAARFNVLRRLIPGVSARMLALQLRELEADGLISRTVHSQVPARVDYALTEEGASLMPILSAMAEWGLQRSGQAAAA